MRDSETCSSIGVILAGRFYVYHVDPDRVKRVNEDMKTEVKVRF